MATETHTTKHNKTTMESALLGEEGCIDFKVLESLVGDQILLFVPFDRSHQRRPDKDHQLVFGELKRRERTKMNWKW